MTASVEPLEPSVSLPRMKKKTRSGVSGLYLNRGGITLPSVPLEDADIDECRTMSAKMQLLSDDASPVIEYAEKRDADTLRSKIRLGGAAVNRCRPLRKAHAELDLMRPEPTSTDATFSAVDKRDEESQLHSDMFLSASQDVDAKPVPRYLYKSSALHEPQSQPSASLDDGLFDALTSWKSSAARESTGKTDLFGIRLNAPPARDSPECDFSEAATGAARMESYGATPAFYGSQAGATPAVGFGGFGGDAPLWGAPPPPAVPGSGAPPPPPPAPGSGLFRAKATTAFGSSAFGFGVGVPQASVTPAVGFGGVGGGGAPMAFGSSALESSGFAFGGGATTTCAAPALAFDAGVSVADRVQAISGGLFGNVASAPVVSDAVTQGFAQAFASPGFGFHGRAPLAHAAPALGFGLFSTGASVASDAVTQGFGVGAASTFAAPAFSAQSFAAPAFSAPAFAAPAFAAPAFDRRAHSVRASPPSHAAPLFGSDESLVTSDTFLASSAAVGFQSSFGSSASSATVSAKRGSAPAWSAPADVTHSSKGKLSRFSHEASRPPPPVFSRRAHPPAPPPPPEPMPISGFAVAPTTSSYIVAPREWSMHSMRNESVASALPEPEQAKATFAKILHGAVSREAVPEPERIQKLRASAENLSPVDLPLPPPSPPGPLRQPFMATLHSMMKSADIFSSPAYMPTSPSYVPTAQQQMETEPLPSSATTDSLMPAFQQSFMKMMEAEPQALRRSSRAVCGLSADVSAAEESMKLPYAPPANQRFRRMKSECRSASQQMPALPPPMGSVPTEKELAPPLPPKKLQSGRGLSGSQSGAFRHRRVLLSSDSDSQALAPVRLSIGIETFGKVMTPIFKYSTPLPATMTKYLTTCADYQTSVRIKVYEGEYPRTSLNHLLGQIQLVGIQPMIRGQAKIKATFNIDVEGSLRVEVVDETTGEYETMTVTINEEEKSEEEIERMIKDAEEMKKREPTEEEDDIQETSDGDCDVCIYDELNAGNVPDFREDLFVSANEMNINTGFVDWTQHTLEALSTSYVQVSIWPAETKEGFWELDDGLGELLFLNTKKCRKILIENGLNSLGTQAHLDVSRLIATFLVLFRTFELRGPLAPYPINATQFNEHLDSIIAGHELESFTRCIRGLLTCAARFCRRIDTKHPLLYSRLNLGRSWPEVAVNMGLALPDIDEIGEAALMASLLG